MMGLVWSLFFRVLAWPVIDDFGAYDMEHGDGCGWAGR